MIAAQSLRSLDRDGRPRSDGLDCANNSLCQRASYFVRISGRILAHSIRWFDRCAEHRGYVLHFLTSVMTKSLGQAFSKACRSSVVPWSPVATGEIPFPKISSARGSPMPAGIGCRGRIARASPMGKGRSMRPFPINERGQQFRLTQLGKNTWAGTALTIIVPFPPPTVRWTVVWRCKACASSSHRAFDMRFSPCIPAQNMVH